MTDAQDEQRVRGESKRVPMNGGERQRLFDELYRTHTSAVWTFALYLTRDRAEAEDLFQDAWLRAVEKMDEEIIRAGKEIEEFLIAFDPDSNF